MTREEASTLFRENDKDKDGFISMEEYFGKERRIRERERARESERERERESERARERESERERAR